MIVTGRTLSAEETWRWDLTKDPRRDDHPEDSHQWVWLLTRVYDAGHEELFAALLFLRCFGVRIIPAAVGFRLGRGICPEEDYERIRTAVLTPQRVFLADLLRRMPTPEWFTPRKGER